MQEIYKKSIEIALDYGPKIIAAIALLVVGLWLIKLIKNLIDKSLDKGKLDDSLKSFLKAASGFLLKVILFITIAAVLGIETTTFIAILSAIGLAIGLALKDSLGNFAGGILILAFRPFNVGDFVEADGHTGTVKAIQLLYTYINTPDNRRVVIPNGKMANSKIINMTAENTRRVDLVIGISYKDDFEKARDIIRRITENHPAILKEPESTIRMVEYAQNSINFAVWVWCQRSDYLTVKFDLLEQIKISFDKEGISIPYQQMDVHLYQNN